MVANFTKIGNDVLKVLKWRQLGQEVFAFLFDWIPSLGEVRAKQKGKISSWCGNGSQDFSKLLVYISRGCLNQRELHII